MSSERLDRHDAIKVLVRQQSPMISIDTRYTIALRDLLPQVCAQFGNRCHLTIGNSDIVPKMGALPHSSDAHKTQTYFRHVRPPFLGYFLLAPEFATVSAIPSLLNHPA